MEPHLPKPAGQKYGGREPSETNVILQALSLNIDISNLTGMFQNCQVSFGLANSGEGDMINSQ